MITIIGAGLCGLSIAYRLKQANVPYCVLEAGSAVGGRIQPAGEGAGHQDLGPSWVWPYAQPIVEEWFDELGITTFEQYDEGDGLLDTHDSPEAVRQFLPGQHGIARVEGGTHGIIRTLMKSVAGDVATNCIVQRFAISDEGITLDVQFNQQHETRQASAVVIATPPRQAARLIPADNTALSSVAQALQQSPTWMAPHAKVVMHYEHAFWREQGLSGRIASQVGPLVEVHDHCGPAGMPAALFGFVGIPAEHRKDQTVLKAAVEQQLKRCFGKDAPVPSSVTVKDWAVEPYISTVADLEGGMMHPTVKSEITRQGYFGGRVWFASSELSRVSPGLIEGAFARGDEVVGELVALMERKRA